MRILYDDILVDIINIEPTTIRDFTFNAHYSENLNRFVLDLKYDYTNGTKRDYIKDIILINDDKQTYFIFYNTFLSEIISDDMEHNEYGVSVGYIREEKYKIKMVYDSSFYGDLDQILKDRILNIERKNKLDHLFEKE